MKIVIVGGKNEADFLIKMFKQGNHKLIVINESREYCNYLSANNRIPVFCGDSAKQYVLEEAQVQNADVIIALCEKDTDNLVICQLASKVFNVKKTVCIVSNPKNVEVFKRLGVNSVISSTYLVAQTIKRESTIENLIKTLSIEDDMIVITEIQIEEGYEIVDKMLMDINPPSNVNISCIIRDSQMIIPNGQTIIKSKDRLVLVSTPNDQNEIIKFIQKRKIDDKK